MALHASSPPDSLIRDLVTPHQEQNSLNLDCMGGSASPAENASLLTNRATRGLDSSAVFKPVNLERKQEGVCALELPPTTPPTRSSLVPKPCDTPMTIKACAQQTGSTRPGIKRTFGFYDENTIDSEQQAEGPADTAPPTLSRLSRPSRQCKDTSLKRIRQAVQDSPLDNEDEDEDEDGQEEEEVAPRSDRRVSSRDSAFYARVPSLSTAEKDKVSLESRHKGPCSYEHCPNPTHSSGGGFKLVSEDTKAGGRDWSPYRGRVFCNACFTQYATRGTLQRPGRSLAHAPAPASSTVEHNSNACRPARLTQPEQNAHTLRKSRLPSPVPSPGSPIAWSEPEEELPTVVEDELEEGEDETCAAVHLEIIADGENLQFQWMRDGRAIPGAVYPTLVISNPGECAGEFTCKVMNRKGSAPAFAPVHFPITLSEAKARYADKSRRPQVMPRATRFRLTCVCGLVREGEPSALCDPCTGCGLCVCGTVEPSYSADGSAITQEVE